MNRLSSPALRTFLAAAGAQAADHDVDTSFGVSGWRRIYAASGGSQAENGVAIARTADGGNNRNLHLRLNTDGTKPERAPAA